MNRSQAAFAVFNPGGRDPIRLFPAGAGCPPDAGHPPVNYHAYAACCGGGFYRQVREIPDAVQTVLLLLRKNGLADASRAMGELRGLGKRIFISWKESGLHQVSEALADAKRYARFRELCAGADGFLASTPEVAEVYRAGGCKAGEFVPTPYPIEEGQWNFAQSLAGRSGIFIGTREFFVPSRNHLAAVAAACRLGHAVTVINSDGAAGEKLLKAVSPNIHLIRKKLPYPKYLRLMAGHRIVLQFDRSAVPGQVAGDALLCRVPCVGGDGAVDRLVFPELCGHGRDFDTLTVIAEKLLKDDAACEDAMAKALSAAEKTVSFAVVRERLLRL